MTAKTFNPKELRTIRFALLQWEARCIAEAKAMRELAAHFDGNRKTESKCEANAKASEAFAAEARAILDGGKL